MNYENIIYLADQILGHIKEGWIQQRGTWQFRVAYPSAAGKPFNVRIYHTPDTSFFYVNWTVKKKSGQLTIHLKPLSRADNWWLCRKKTRSKAGKRIRAEESRLQFKNIIMLAKDSSRDELCLQIGCYLTRDGFLDNATEWKIRELFNKYASKHFFSVWRKINESPEGLKAFDNLCSYFNIPADAKSFCKYLKSTFTGINKTIYNKSPDYFNCYAKKELRSTFYAWIYAGKIKPQKVKGKYVLSPEQSVQLKKDSDEKRKQDNIRKGLVEFAEKKGMNPEKLAKKCSEMEKSGRFRRKGHIIIKQTINSCESLFRISPHFLKYSSKIK